RQTAALRSALLRKLTEEQIERVADLLLEKALDGDLAAIRLVLLYAIGKPTPAVDPDQLDRLEFAQHRGAIRPAEFGRLSAGLMSSDRANELLRIALPCSGANIARMYTELQQARAQPAEDDQDEEPVDDEPAAAPPPAPQPQAEAAPEPSVLPF